MTSAYQSKAWHALAWVPVLMHTLWATMPVQAQSIPELLLNTPYQWPAYIRGNGQYQFVLSPRALSSGITFEGPNERLRVVLDRWKRGEKLIVATVGGSVTFGQGSSDAPSYPQYVENYLQDYHTNIQLVNGALCAITSSYMALCHNIRVPRNADVIIVEYNTNDPNYPTPVFTNHHRMAYERLIRKLLSYPRKPAVLLMHSYSWTNAQDFPAGTFWSTAETELQTVANYYQLPTLSVRTACYHLLRLQALGFWRNVTRDQNHAELAEKAFNTDATHPSGRTGARVMAELVINFIERTLQSIKSAPVSAEDKAMADLPLPPPMIPGNHHSMHDQCFMGKTFTQIVTRSQGFEWRNDARKPNAQKWGMVATTVGSVLELTVDSRSTSVRDGVADQKVAQAPTLVQLAYLRSYENVGTAEVTCVSGCTCQPAKMEGYTTKRNSQLNFLDVTVTQHERCTLRVTVLNETTTGSHKIRVSACVVSDDAGRDGLNNDISGPLTDQEHAMSTGTVEL